LAFRQLFADRFPIRQMRVVDDFGGDDERSMLAGNTSAFNCQLVPSTSTWAQHAYGLAVDINPLETRRSATARLTRPPPRPGRPVTLQPGDDQGRGRRLTRVPRHRLDVGRGLALAEGLHALLRQRVVSTQWLTTQGR
jgi:hypothetical protein